MEIWRKYRIPSFFWDNDVWVPKYIYEKPSTRFLLIEPFDGGMCIAEWLCTDEQNDWLLSHDDVEAIQDD